MKKGTEKKYSENDAVTLDAYVNLNIVSRICNRFKLHCSLYYMLEMIHRFNAAGTEPYAYKLYAALSHDSKILTSGMIKKLEKAGYIESSPGITEYFNRPTVKYRLTPSGNQIRIAISKNVNKYFAMLINKRNKLSLMNKNVAFMKEELKDYKVPIKY
jgi:DNA-binding MarR family transcriptional regulator